MEPRKNSREASDAGIILWRQNFSILLLFFALPFWIIAFTLRITLPGNLQYYSWLVIWFLKPLFDRVIMHVISVRFFEKEAGRKRIFQGLGKNLRRGLSGDLLWRRLSPLRPSVMPVRVLEVNLKTGKGTAKRIQILKKGGLDYCFFLTIWAIAVEIALLAGEIIFFITALELFMPGFVSSIDNFLDIEIYFYAAWCFNFMLVETIYVCMGFSLYINSRIEAEGWDIEIRFRNFSQLRQRAYELTNNGKNTVIVICLFIFLFMPLKSYTEENSQQPPLEQLQAILDSPEFGGETDTWGIRFKNETQENDLSFIDSEFIERLQKISARVLQIFLISFITGIIIFLIIFLFKHKPIMPAYKKNSGVKTIFDNHTEDPKRLLGKALDFYEKGELRLSWGYCTSAAIKSWTVYHGIVFPPNAAESDCLDIINSMNIDNSRAQAFEKLIKNWIYLAYAGQLPADGSFEEALMFVKASFIQEAKNG